MRLICFYLTLVILPFGVHSLPRNFVGSSVIKRQTRAFHEWTAMGDSYASGIGAGNTPAEFNRCFKYPDAYPSLMQNEDNSPGDLLPMPEKWNNVACSGNTFQEILDKQFLDSPLDDGWYGTRPPWGDSPEFITLTMGGNDIGILNLVTTCIYAFKLFGKSCEEVIASSRQVLESSDFSDKATEVIRRALDKGRGKKAGENFSVVVTGYARFFNEGADQCDDISFSPIWNPFFATKLTKERRRDMNNLASALNEKLKSIVQGYNGGDPHVHFVDIDPIFENHRFCDRQEPDHNDPETWFFNLFEEASAQDTDLQNLVEKMPAFQASLASNDTGIQSDADFINAVSNTGDGVVNIEDWKETVVGFVRVFHPKSDGHRAIKAAVENTLRVAGLPVPEQLLPSPPPEFTCPAFDPNDYDDCSVCQEGKPDEESCLWTEGIDHAICNCPASCEHVLCTFSG